MKVERCKCCGHKLKYCSACGVVQTPENSTLTRGRFESTCKKCTAERVLRIKYDKMQIVDLSALLDKHEKVVAQLSAYLSDRKRREGAEE